MERKNKNQKRRIVIFWLVIVIIGLLLILGSALYFSNKTVAKQTYNIQTDIELDSDGGVVVPSIVILEGSYESHPAEPEVPPTEKQEPTPVIVEPTPTTETETETEQEVKQEIEAEVLEPVEQEAEEVKAEVLEPVEEKVEIKAEVIEPVEQEKEEVKAEVLETDKQQYEIKAEVLEGTSVETGVKAEVLEAPKSKGFAVKKIEFSESQIFEDKELDAIVKESKKDHAGMDLLNDVVDKVNEEYEEKGYPNAVAYIPEQTAKDGVFKIELVEGKLGSFTVVDNNFTFDAYYLWRFHFNRKKPLNLKDFEHQLILFNKWNDGYAATATINPGKTAGTSDITLNAKETHPLSIIGVYDNYGSEGTGKLRVGAHLVLQSLLKMRDTLQAGIIANTAFNAPYVDYSILTPSLRLRIGARYSVGNSEVVSGPAKDYKIKGSNVSQSAYFSVPIMETSALQFTLTGSANYLHSKSISMDEIILSEITITSGQIGGTYVYSPENAYLVHTLNITKAVPYLDTNSSFTKIDGSFNFNFGLFKLATLVLKAQYQLVIDSEVDFPRVMYMQAGGATTVRGYAEACNEGKDGFIGNVELHLPIIRSEQFNINLYGFADYAFVVPDPNHGENSMWSWGIGADVDLGAIHASAVYGWPQINLTQDPNATNGRLHIAIKLAPIFSNK